MAAARSGQRKPCLGKPCCSLGLAARGTGPSGHRTQGNTAVSGNAGEQGTMCVQPGQSQSSCSHHSRLSISDGSSGGQLGHPQPSWTPLLGDQPCLISGRKLMESLTMVASGGERKGRWESKTHFFLSTCLCLLNFVLCVCVLPIRR